MLATVLRPMAVLGRAISTRGSLAVERNRASARYHQPGAMMPPGVFALVGDHVEGGGGAEVDHHRALREPGVGGHGVDDAVGADLARVLVEDGHAAS